MEAYALTDIGQVRSMNQDYIYSSPERVGSLPNLFLVADGMGGHQAGDYASRFAVENLVIYLNREGKGSPVMQLKTGIGIVNGLLYEESLLREELKGMGCTLVAGVVEDNLLYVANVGDSRLYLIHNNTIRQITRAMGIGRDVEPDFFEVDLEEGDHILLCSDGLSNMVDDESMCRIITGEGSLKEKASRLIQEANRQGGIDNIAVVLVNPLGREDGLC